MTTVYVTIEAIYTVDVDTDDAQKATQDVFAKWDSVYKYKARPATFPPEMSGRVVGVQVAGKILP